MRIDKIDKKVLKEFLLHCKTMDRYTDSYEVESVYIEKAEPGVNDHFVIRCSYIEQEFNHPATKRPQRVCTYKRNKNIHIEERKFTNWYRNYILEELLK